MGKDGRGSVVACRDTSSSLTSGTVIVSEVNGLQLRCIRER